MDWGLVTSGSFPIRRVLDRRICVNLAPERLCEPLNQLGVRTDVNIFRAVARHAGAQLAVSWIAFDFADHVARPTATSGEPKHSRGHDELLRDDVDN